MAIDGANLTIQAAPTAADVTRASVVLLFAFTGIESALVPSGEVQDPARTVPRAVFIAMGGVTVLYLGLQFVAQGVLGTALATSTTPLADAASYSCSIARSPAYGRAAFNRSASSDAGSTIQA